MGSKMPSIEDFQEILGDEYSIKIIDGERCLYCDLGNGFDIEISGMQSRKRKAPLSIYLWQTKVLFTIKVTVKNIERSTESIKIVVEYMKKYTNKLVSNGIFENKEYVRQISCNFDELNEYFGDM